MLIWIALVASGCSTAKQDCPNGKFCEAAYDYQAKVCPDAGACVPLPPAADIELSLPVPEGDAVFCGKGNLRAASDSHHACNQSTRFAFDLVSSMFVAPHLVLASADGVARTFGGCSSADLTHQDKGDECNWGFGNLVRVQHDGGVYTQYAHLSAILVNDGQKVVRGQPIGVEGNSGQAGAKHIHWSLHQGDPMVGGMSVPMKKIRTSAGVFDWRSLRCGDWTRTSVPAPDTRHVSANKLVSEPETFFFKASLANSAVSPDVAQRCPKFFVSIAPGVCFAPPKVQTDKHRVILWLHGMYDPSAGDEVFESERRFFEKATKRGYAVLAPRGQVGLCDWKPSWACWPSGGGQKPAAARFVAGLHPMLAKVSSQLGIADKIRPFVVGFSNGGFFTAMLAADTKLDVSAWAILHGGIVEPAMFDAGLSKATFLLAAEKDQWQRPKMEALAKRMTDDGWKPTLRVRPGEHGISDDDVAATLDFFDKASEVAGVVR